MTNNYIIRPYKHGDEENIVDLLNLVFHEWPHFDLACTSSDHWKWKYLDNPNELKIIAIAELDERIIGCWHRIPQKIKFGDQIIYATQGVDVAVHPDFQGKGISTKLRELAQDISLQNNMPMMIGINTNPIIRESAIRRGYSDFPNFRVMVKIHNIDLHLKMTESKYKIFKKWGYYTYKFMNNLEKLKMKKNEKEINIFNIEKFDDRINQFWNEIEKNYNFMVIKNKGYLNWRFCDPRAGKYIIKQAEEDDHILGYCILRINKYKKEYLTGYIIDLITLPHRLDVAEALINNAILYFNKIKVNSIRCWQFKNSIYNLLKKHDFINLEKIFLQYKFLDKTPTLKNLGIIPSDSLHFSMGDSDSI